MALFSIAKAITFKNEGGYSTSRKDTGNWYKGIFFGSKSGVTPQALSEYLRRELTVSDVNTMRNLPVSTITQIKKTMFWDKLRADEIRDQNVANLLFDFYYWKPSKAIKFLREITRTSGNVLKLNSTDINAINAADPRKLFNALKAARVVYTKSLASVTFGEGWLKRAYSFNYKEDAGTKMALTIPKPQETNDTANVLLYGIAGYLLYKTFIKTA